jgi:tetratricopeptide (TPR) repeat protein
MSRWVTMLAGVLLLAGTHAPAAARMQAPQAEIKAIKEFETLQVWSRAVWAHNPGEFDASVRAIAAWRESDLAEVRADIWAIATLVSRGSSPGAMIRYTGFSQEINPASRVGAFRNLRSIKMADVSDLVSLPVDRRTSRVNETGITHFMQLAAMLHADVAMLSEPPSGLRRPQSGLAQSTPAGRITDGEVTGWAPGPIHWEIGRIALRGVRPLPQSDPVVAMWYRATSAYLVSRRQYGYLAPHLEQGRAILPEDAHLQLYDGVLHEAYASSVVQEALQSLRSGRFLPTAQSSADELEQAERYFRRALELDPGLDVARVRLGRVLGLRGRHDQAAAELRLALSSLTDPRQRYYAELFLGAEEQALGRMSEAKGALDRANSLFPNAQAPYLALGQLAWQSADRAGAQVAFERLAALPGVLADREDPWWSYPVSTVLDTATLVERLTQLVAEQVRK